MAAITRINANAVDASFRSGTIRISFAAQDLFGYKYKKLYELTYNIQCGRTKYLRGTHSIFGLPS